MPVVLDSVSFRYGRRKRWILDDLTWSPASGVTFLLGPNGAGKTTVLNLIASLRAPATGTVSVGDLTLTRAPGTLKQWRRTVGWVPQQIDPVPGMTARQQVAYAGWLKGMPRREAEAAAGEALAAVGLEKKADDKVTTLSGGQVRRVGIASALVHDCSVIVMDEPTAGLDPNQRARLFRVVQRMDHVDWIISTHQTEDIALRASEVSVLDQGRLVWQGAPAEFLALDVGDSDESRAVAAYRSLVGDEA